MVAYREAPGVRVDSGIEEGTEVGTDYDPMLAKVVATGDDRDEALERLRRALGATVVAGPTTNVAYLRALLARPEVRAGEMDTGLIERLGDEVAAPRRHRSSRGLVTLLGEPRTTTSVGRPAGGAGPGLDARRARGRRRLVGPRRLAHAGPGLDPADAVGRTPPSSRRSRSRCS